MGAEVLRRFTVILDYPHRRAIPKPNARFGDPSDADMSGIVLAKNASGVVRVLAVRPDTPAAQLGIRAGYEIATIDGRAATALPLDTLSRWLRIPDRDYRLALRRAGQPVEVVLHSTRLILKPRHSSTESLGTGLWSRETVGEPADCVQSAEGRNARRRPSRMRRSRISNRSVSSGTARTTHGH